ncbi:PREDICTED: DNA mismatch repair protein Mlh3-like [Amphimedon queenslandica]|uniref:MutL C-terminal dimerisation domain-containing protein n=1 Tax=Amphimedon queenslandica TaxID=400682 RepID=A0A1X7TRE7_AMPQE|nr:PREDICTED: DNA mismatch repair protein Mlh3-like [Amphimedon queenslandica]|eukprot:XP_019858092.1 PREDICTED: DNA mismatch repair protein Mlh3-like [Amphimedon queenslandica]
MSFSKPLRFLSESLRSQIRSGLSLSSLVQCVEELVLNSIDAGATQITVHVDISHLLIKVFDNGVGIGKEDMMIIGERYATSKCHSLKDLEDLRSYGYRGEALASLIKICGKVDITSRQRLSPLTYTKSFHSGVAFPLKESLSSLHHKTGTTVALSDIFQSLPVRRKSLSEPVELERIRRSLSAIALIHSSVSFSLHDGSFGNGRLLLQTKGTGGMLSAFSFLFGKEIAQSLREVSRIEAGYTVSGYISTSPHHSKSIQMIYINKRLVCKTRLHSHVNKLLDNSLIAHCKDSAQYNRSQSKTRVGGDMSPKAVYSERFGVYVLNIQCSKTEVDIFMDPDKSLVEFKKWDKVLSVLSLAVRSFLKEHHLSLRVEKSLVPSSSFLNDGESNKENDACISFGVYSHSVQRLSPPSVSAPMTSYPPLTSPSRKRGIISLKIKEKLLGSDRKRLRVSSSDEKDCSSVPFNSSSQSHSSSNNNSTKSNIDSPSLTSDCKSLSSTDSHLNSCVSSSAAPPAKEPSLWQLITGPDSKPLYINKATGNCQSEPPASLLSPSNSSIGSTYGCQPLRAAPHLTYGFSPLLPKPKQIQNSQTSLTSLHTSTITPIGKAASSKSITRDNESLKNNKWRERSDSILSNWTNPAFRGEEGPAITDIGLSKASSSQIKVHSLINSYKFTTDMLKHVKVLGQIDNKFIACTLKTEELKDDLLVLFDQHAADERVRLEALTEGIYDLATGNIKSVRIDPSLTLKLNELDRRLALTYARELKNIGVKVSCKHEMLLVSELPAILTERDIGEKQKIKLAQDLILKHLELFCLKTVSEKVRGGGGAMLPISLHKVLCSLACHGAIKFGDSLTVEQCSELIASLSKCKLPFQCAHGRPSLMPIVNLSLLEKRFPPSQSGHTTTNKLNLNKLIPK